MLDAPEPFWAGPGFAHMSQDAQPIVAQVYTESTPNPASLKFTTDRILLPQLIFEAARTDDAAHSPLAEDLFRDFPVIERVFISNNFITLTKMESEEEWFELSLHLKPWIKDYIEAGKPIVTDGFLEAQKEARAARDAKRENDSEADERIKELLDKYVRPAVEMDGGHIAFKSFEDGVVTLIMQGACSGCPSSTVTLKEGIQSLLQRMVPGVTEVVAEAED